MFYKKEEIDSALFGFARDKTRSLSFYDDTKIKHFDFDWIYLSLFYQNIISSIKTMHIVFGFLKLFKFSNLIFYHQLNNLFEIKYFLKTWLKTTYFKNYNLFFNTYAMLYSCTNLFSIDSKFLEIMNKIQVKFSHIY